jgi:hypothetical protein
MLNCELKFTLVNLSRFTTLLTEDSEIKLAVLDLVLLTWVLTEDSEKAKISAPSM